MLKKWLPIFLLCPYGDGEAQIDSSANAIEIGFCPFFIIMKSIVYAHYVLILFTPLIWRHGIVGEFGATSLSRGNEL
jgi:hypothetical protein